MKKCYLLSFLLISTTYQLLCMENLPDDLLTKIIACCNSKSKNNIGKSCKKFYSLYSKNNCAIYCQSPLYLTRRQKEYALPYCAYKNCIIGVKNLLEHGARSTRYQGLGTFAIDIALNNKNNEIITLLQKAQEKQSKNPVLSKHILAAYMGNIKQLKKYVKSKKYTPFYKDDIYENSTLLHLAIINGHTAVITLLLKNKKTLNCINTNMNTGGTPICCAARKGNANILEQLLKIPRITTNAYSLSISIRYNYIACVKTLLQYYPSFLNQLFIENIIISTINNNEITDSISISPLAIASFYKHYKIVKYLLSYKNININNASKAGFTPLYAASEKGAANIVQLLLEQRKLDATIYMCNYSALHIACQKKHTEIVKLLVTHRPELVNMKAKKNGNTALHIAALYNGIEEAKILLQTPDIDINLINFDGETALDIAQRMKRPQIRTLLLNKIWSKNK